MSSTYTSLLVHVVFSTYKRVPSITPEYEQKLFEYINAIIREIKRSTSFLINKNNWSNQRFKRQEGYGAFSVSYSEKDKVINYIKKQKEHHRKKSFKEEMVEILNFLAIKYQLKYL